MVRHTVFRHLLLAVLGCALLRSGAFALPIDFIEDGPFSLTANPGATDSGSQAVSLLNCIASTRFVTLTSQGGVSFAGLSVGPFDDEITTVLGEGGARLDLRYVPAGVDITQGGVLTHILVRVSVAEPSGRIEIRLTDTSGNSVLTAQVIFGPGTLFFPLSDFTGVDLGSVQDVLVSLVTEQLGDYHIQDIRVEEVASMQAAADFVIQTILGGATDRAVLWTHEEPVDNSHVAQGGDARLPAVNFPFPINRLFMVDPTPDANWAHPVQWVFVDGSAGELVVVERDWIPSIVDAAGRVTGLSCQALTAVPCATTGATAVQVDPAHFGYLDKCLYAVLISGGWNDGSNYSRYPENLTSMYQTLLGLGFGKSQIWTYYADGTEPLDMDNADGDNNHATGSDITGGAVEANISARIAGLCNVLNPNRDVLFIYTSNHGGSNGDLILWDFNSDGMWTDSEHYSPAELAVDTEDCNVCRLFGIFDQCYSGAFLPMVNDGDHPNTAFYSAATADEVSWGREYLDWWEDLDVDNMSMNALHNSVANSGTLQSTALMAQSASGIGNVTLDYCWGEELFHLPSDLTYWDDTVSVQLSLCNPLPSTQYYHIAPSGLPVSSGCDVAGPTSFSLSESSPIAVAPGQCRSVTLTIDRPAGLGGGQTACYQVQVNNYALGVERTLTGRLHGPSIFQLCFEPPAEQHTFLHPLDPIVIEFTVENVGPVQSLNYELQAVASDGLAQNLVVGLDGQAPGEIVRGNLRLDAGATVQIPVSVQMLDDSSQIFYDLQLSVEEPGTKQGFTIVSSVGLRQEMEIDTSTADPTPRRGPIALSLVPNPFNPRLSVRFELDAAQAGQAKVDVLDARGRRVRGLAAAGSLHAGAQELVWDGHDDTGVRVASGAYFVRLVVMDGTTVERAVLVK